MTRADTDLHDVPSAAALEQLTRWAVADSWSGRRGADYAAGTVSAAAEGSPDAFRAALAKLAEHDGPRSQAAMLQATLWRNVDAVGVALAGNDGLQALYRTAAQRAEGIDVAEVATANRLRLRAEYEGEEYQTAVFVEDPPGRTGVLASGGVVARSAIDALRVAAQREHAVHGLDQTDMRLVDQQLSRLERLTAPHTAATRPDPAGAGTNRWADTVARAVGEDLRIDPGWATLAATLDRAADAGWDVAGHLPVVGAATPLPAPGSAAHELAYRVMDACPDAAPPAPSLAQINGTEHASTSRQREAAERAIVRAPTTGRPPTVGR